MLQFRQESGGSGELTSHKDRGEEPDSHADLLHLSFEVIIKYPENILQNMSFHVS